MTMKRTILYMLAFMVSGLPGFAASLGTAARTVIPIERPSRLSTWITGG